METLRQEVPVPEDGWENVRPTLLHDVDEQDEQGEEDEGEEAKIDAQVVDLVDEREAHDVGGNEDEHKDEVEDGKPSAIESFQIIINIQLTFLEWIKLQKLTKQSTVNPSKKVKTNLYLATVDPRASAIGMGHLVNGIG